MSAFTQKETHKHDSSQRGAVFHWKITQITIISVACEHDYMMRSTMNLRARSEMPLLLNSSQRKISVTKVEVPLWQLHNKILVNPCEYVELTDSNRTWNFRIFFCNACLYILLRLHL